MFETEVYRGWKTKNTEMKYVIICYKNKKKSIIYEKCFITNCWGFADYHREIKSHSFV